VESGTPTVRSAGVCVGSAGTLSSLLQPFLSAVGTAPTYNYVGPQTYLNAMLIEGGCEGLSVAQCHTPDQNPAGTLSRSSFAAKSAYVSAAPPSAGISAAVAGVQDLADQDPTLGGGLVFDAYGGAINTVTPAATAFVHRNALCCIESSVSWTTTTPAATISLGRQWLAQSATTMAPYTDGGAYQNYIDPTLVNWQQAYYGANLPRLSQVKTTYDPDGVFRFAQSIPGAAG
jgi:hypothetical protein